MYIARLNERCPSCILCCGRRDKQELTEEKTLLQKKRNILWDGRNLEGMRPSLSTLELRVWKERGGTRNNVFQGKQRSIFCHAVPVCVWKAGQAGNTGSRAEGLLSDGFGAERG